MESLARGEDVGSAEAGTLGAICDAFPTALLTLDADGVVRGFNAAWARAMGTTRMAAAFSRAVHPEDRARWSALLHGLCDARGHAAAPARERLLASLCLGRPLTIVRPHHRSVAQPG